MKYDHKNIEKKWQEAWEKTKIYTTPDAAPGKDNFYLLVEFPYPSGNLHVGHWYAFAVPDILARFMRMQGKNVLYPIGFDAFGLPAENAAIKNKLNPRTWTYGNIEYMKKQIASMGAMFDWSREVITCDPEYYKWTQWLFLQLYKKGLVYQKETAVNWCPKDKTVLANEQVVDGKCERCDSEVEQRQMLQWNIKITEYADRLIEDLALLDWPEQIKESQRNWIGRSEGAEIDFPLVPGGKEKYTYVILHGLEGRPTWPRFLFWKERLEAMGHTVVIPELPNPDQPNEHEQVEAALSAVPYDENTVLFGHSLGAVIAMKVVERLKKPIARLVLAGGFVDPNFKDSKKRNFSDGFVWQFNAESITKNAGTIQILHDNNDFGISDAQVENLEKTLGQKANRMNAEKSHFTGPKEPDVLMWLRPAIRVFTTRPDTLFGATYLVLAPEHRMVEQLRSQIENWKEVEAYISRTQKMSDMDRQTTKEKTGVQLKGVEAVNPADGAKIPVYIADYVLPQYGTGAIMAVPAHDERDWEFAIKFQLPIKQVVRPVFNPQEKKEGTKWRDTVSAFVRNDKGEVLMLRWPEYKWLTGVVGGIEEGETPEQAAVREVYEETGYRAKALFASPIAIESHYYAEHKKEWRSRIDTAVLLELERDEHDAISAEEAALHDAHWIKIDEALQMEMFPNNKLALELALGRETAYTGSKYKEAPTLVNSGAYDGMSVEEGIRALTDVFGRKKTTYKLRDWIVSRQRYWGVPIPMVHCEKCGYQPVPNSELPVVLPEVEDYLPGGSGKSPLAKVAAFVNVKCPKCGEPARRETDTLDTFVDSSWYFLRYTDPKNRNEFAAREMQDHWMPVDLYSGGAEHTTMHLLYSRFWHKALFDIGLVKDAEPYKRRMNRSLILGPDGQKMSKSRGNVIDPDEIVELLGADTVRMYLAFVGPYNEVASYPWNPDGVVGVRRFLERIARAQEHIQDADVDTLNVPLHKAMKKVGEDITALKFNTAISQLMILLNVVEKEKKIGAGQWKLLVRMLAPFAPHLAEELWSVMGNSTSIHLESWPAYDEKFLQDDVITIAIQINGKMRGEIRVAHDLDDASVEAAAREAVAARLEGQQVVRTIVVPGRLVNFVVKA